MGLLPDWSIKQNVVIKNAAEQKHREGIISYGYTSYGYDARIGWDFQIFDPIGHTIVDPKHFNQRALRHIDLGKTLSLANKDGAVLFDPLMEKTTEKMFSIRSNIPLSKYDETVDYIIIPPNSFALGHTIEEFIIPRDCLAIVLGKSTYARCGVIVNVTPLEPEWRGQVTVEISNTTQLPVKIYAGEGIMQVLFIRGTDTCRTSYLDKKGKYQNQKGVVLPKVN